MAEGLDWFGGQRLGPAQALDPAAFGAATSYAANAAANSSAQWTELGPYAYAKDDRRYVSDFSNNGSGSGYSTGRITGVAASPDGHTLFATGAGGGIWRATDYPAFQAWQPVGDALPTTATG
ncbi:MAG: glycosyl hydrolase, partial [Acidimicrobiales bacterium]